MAVVQHRRAGHAEQQAVRLVDATLPAAQQRCEAAANAGTEDPCALFMRQRIGHNLTLVIEQLPQRELVVAA